MNKRKWLTYLFVTTLIMGLLATGVQTQAGAQGNSRTFPETGKSVKGLFLQYWEQNGALPQQGYPITDEFQHRSETDGKTYTMQCFERAVFENHPENAGTKAEVLLSLLGNFYYKQKYQFNAPPGQTASTDNPRVFPETGKTLGGIFRQYWEQNGGLAQQGFPITDEFMEKSDLNGQTYRVQYFERAVFEYHPENQPPYNVLLSQLGKFMCPANKPAPSPSPTPNPNFDPNKYYRLSTEFRADNMCLETPNSSFNGVALYDCSTRTSSGQSWRITAAPGGKWKIASQLKAGMCLDTYNGGQTNNYAFYNDCSKNTTGQLWTIKPVAGKPGYYALSNDFRGPNMCLDIVNGGQNNNYAYLTTCGAFTGQRWKFTEVK